MVGSEREPYVSLTGSVLGLLEFDSNSNTNVMDFYYYFIILTGIEFGIKFSLESGTVFYN